MTLVFDVWIIGMLVHFSYFMDFLEEKKTYIFIYNFKSHFLHTQAFSDILKLSNAPEFCLFVKRNLTFFLNCIVFVRNVKLSSNFVFYVY
jgi:hypothetical protein